MRKPTRATATQANRKISKKRNFPLDKPKALSYNKDVRKKNKHQKKEGMYYD